MKRFLLLLFISLSFFVQAQELTQTIRGTIIDKQTQSPLPGTIVQLLNSDPQKITTSDENGKFRLENIPLGRWQQNFTISPNILIMIQKEFTQVNFGFYISELIYLPDYLFFVHIN